MWTREPGGMPLYAQIRDSVRARVRGGEFVSGRLPTTKALCVEYGVAGMTVKRAMDALVGEGLVVARQGSGFFVAPVPVSWPCRRVLSQWVAGDVAMFVVGRALGLVAPSAGFEVFKGAEGVLGGVLWRVLMVLVSGGVLEFRGQGFEGEFRWSVPG